ncbi:MAG TPA: RidA family protein [Terriglobales bacterium]
MPTPTSSKSHVFSGSKFESLFGFSRAIRVGDYIHVSGTAPILDGKPAYPGDPGAQARRCFEIIESALKELGADRRHVIRTRMFLTRISDWQAVGAAHAEFFSDVRPAATMVETSGLIDPEWLVEIEADAYFPTHDKSQS